jgi:hypothetical protein
MLGALSYVLQGHKVGFEGGRVESGVNCIPYTSYLEVMTTKGKFKKTGDVCFYHFVQSFSVEEKITPWQANEVARGLAEKLFPHYECVVATHNDTDNLHSHIIVNSIRFKDGKKLHLPSTSIQEMRQVNDEICMAHGFSVLEPYDGRKKKRRFTPGEYRAAERGESWKFALIKAIEEALLYSTDKESFIQNMEYEGYTVRWGYLKYILFTTPEGKSCRNRSLHDDTYLKENLERLFAYRAEHGFTPLTPEGWLGQIEQVSNLASDIISLGKNLESTVNVPPPFTPQIWTESKQRQREAIKKLAQGHKLQSEQEQDFTQSM